MGDLGEGKGEPWNGNAPHISIPRLGGILITKILGRQFDEEKT